MNGISIMKKTNITNLPFETALIKIISIKDSTMVIATNGSSYKISIPKALIGSTIGSYVNVKKHYYGSHKEFCRLIVDEESYLTVQPLLIPKQLLGFEKVKKFLELYSDVEGIVEEFST